MKKKFAALAAGVLMAAGLSVAVAPVASAASCAGTYRIVVPGFGHGDNPGRFVNLPARGLFGPAERRECA